MADTYDILVIGAGPGGYVTAIRAAQLGFKDGGRRPRASRRHLPQLGLHPDEGAAALGRDLPLPAAPEGLRADDRGQGRLRCRRHRQALARRVGAALGRRRLPDEEEQGRRDLGRGGDRRARQGHRQAGDEIGAGPPVPAPKGALGPGSYQAKHIIIATGARPRVLPGHRARRQADLDLFRGHGAEGDAEVAAGHRLGRDRHRVRLLLPHHGRGGDGRRAPAADPAGRGRRDRERSPASASRSRASRSSPAPRSRRSRRAATPSPPPSRTARAARRRSRPSG